MIPLRVTLIAIPLEIWASEPKDRPLAELSKDVDGAERRIRKGINTRREMTRYTQLVTYIETVALELSLRSAKGWFSFTNRRRDRVRTIEWSDSTSSEQLASEFLRFIEELDVRIQAVMQRGDDVNQLSTLTWLSPKLIPAFQSFLLRLRNDFVTGFSFIKSRSRASSARSRIGLAWSEFVQALLKSFGTKDGEESVISTFGRSIYAPGQPVSEHRRFLERLNTQMLESLFTDSDRSQVMAFAVLTRKLVSFYRDAEHTKSAVVIVLSQKSGS